MNVNRPVIQVLIPIKKNAYSYIIVIIKNKFAKKKLNHAVNFLQNKYVIRYQLIHINVIILVVLAEILHWMEIAQ